MSEYESLTAALARWFERPFTRLPRKLRQRVEKDFLIPWVILSPHRRRMVALQVDWQRHPGLQQGHRTWSDKSCEIDKYERTASEVPIERRTAADVDFQEQKLTELREELATIEAAMNRTAESLGLVYSADPTTVRENPERAPEEPAESNERDHGPEYLPTDGPPVLTVTRQEWSDATVGDQGIPGSASSRIAARRDRAARMGDEPISLNDLPAWWTLHQSIAWIMFRNVTLVSELAAIGALEFAATLAHAEHQDLLPLSVPTVYLAEEELLVRTRAGDIHAQGKIAGREGYQLMESLDWVDGKLSTERDHPVVSPLRPNGKFWYDVMLPKDRMVSVWRPFNADLHQNSKVPLVTPATAISVAVPNEHSEPDGGSPLRKPLPRFNASKAMSLLVAKKVNGDWRLPPREIESREFLLLHFSGVPNDPHRGVRHKVWPGKIKRGPRGSTSSAE